MRRAIAAAVTGGLVLGGAVATPCYAAARGAGRGTNTTSTTSTTKTVVYDGYEFQVPASWPVYRLDTHPQTCVRYDVHAVYLGIPGPDMRCRAGLVGRAQTVSFIPGQQAGTGSGARGPLPPGGNSGTELRGLPAVRSRLIQNTEQHELWVTLGTQALGATVIGTYGTNPAVVEQVLSTLRPAQAGPAPTAQPGPAPVRSGGTVRRAPASAVSSSWPGVPASWPVEVVESPQPPPAPFQPVGGFDTCTAPPVSTMHAWRGDYAVIGVYIGGSNSACAYGNLSASWVRSVAGEGWGMLPVYVGPQAPCWGGSGVPIDPGSAAAEGTTAAASAVSDARAFGLGPGSPIYYDLESYTGGTSCTDAVLQFISAWDQKVTAAGYLAGVYSSQKTGISDMQAAASEKTPGFTPPDAVWFALWDNDPTLSNGGLWWPISDRTKQYAGNVNVTLAGITLNIDKDIVGGPVAH